MIFTALNNHYSKALGLGLLVLNCCLLQLSPRQFSLLENVVSLHPLGIQLLAYDPPDDLGFPVGGEPGGTR